MPYQPFSMGNALAQAEGIVGQRNRNALAQQQLDPRSLPNQLRQAQLDEYRNPAPEQYTLNPGQQRMSGTEVIASRPATPKEPKDPFEGSFTLGDNRYNRNGSLLVKGEPDKATTTADDKTRFDQSNKLRDEFAKATGPFAKVNDAYSRIEASAVDPSAAGDMALIFNYMKMLDPGSVVRESEFALAASSGDYGERIQSYWNQATNGQRLSDPIRADFVDRSKRLFNRANVDYKKREGEFSRIAVSFGLDPTQIIYNQAVAGGENNDGSLSDDEAKELEDLRAWAAQQGGN